MRFDGGVRFLWPAFRLDGRRSTAATEVDGDPLEREAGQQRLCRSGGTAAADDDGRSAEPVEDVVVEPGAVDERDRRDDPREDDREQCERRDDDACAERTRLHRGSSR